MEPNDRPQRKRTCEGWRAEGCGFGERFFNITWCDKVCDEEVLWRVGKERAIISVRVWLGQTLRHGDHVLLVIEGGIPGKRPPGRPRAGMLG